MSNTYKHKGKGLWNNGIEDTKRKEIKKYLNHCDRHNSEKSFFEPLRLKKISDAVDISERLEVDEISEPIE